jgi:hypothetical protein
VGADEAPLDVSHIHDGNDQYFRYWRWATGAGGKFVSLEHPVTLPGRAMLPLERVIARLVSPHTARAMADRYEARIAPFGYSFEDCFSLC